MFQSIQHSCTSAARSISNSTSYICRTVKQNKVMVATVAVAASALASYEYSETLFAAGSYVASELTPVVMAMSSAPLYTLILVGGGVLCVAVIVATCFELIKQIRGPIVMESWMTKEAAGIDQTYDSDGSRNIDYTYVDEKHNFGYVADGAGHNKPGLKRKQEDLFKKFNERWVCALKTRKFYSPQDIREALLKHLRFLASEIDSAKFTEIKDGCEIKYAPAFSFAQVVKVKEQHFLLTAQLADCMLLTRKSDGCFSPIHTPEKDKGNGEGIGHDNSNGQPVVPDVRIRKISSGCEVFGLGDGIGEFLTLSQLKEAIDSNSNRADLLDELKQLIIETGQQLDKHYKAISKEEKKDASYTPTEIKPANGEKTLKWWMEGDQEFSDDISLFCFKVK